MSESWKPSKLDFNLPEKKFYEVVPAKRERRYPPLAASARPAVPESIDSESAESELKKYRNQIRKMHKQLTDEQSANRDLQAELEAARTATPAADTSPAVAQTPNEISAPEDFEAVTYEAIEERILNDVGKTGDVYEG